MLTTKYTKMLRATMLSKLLLKQSSQVPALIQAVLQVKAENTFDSINNVCLLTALTGSNPKLLVINNKKGLMHPRVILTGNLLTTFMNEQFPLILKRTIDKLVSISYGAKSHKLSFTFKASDAIPVNIRKLWKLFETEIGVFELELTFITTSNKIMNNEMLLRSYQIPVAISLK